MVGKVVITTNDNREITDYIMNILFSGIYAYSADRINELTYIYDEGHVYGELRQRASGLYRRYSYKGD